MEYYGRSTNGGEPYQYLLTHLTEVSNLMGDYCEKFTIREIGEICGMLHDIGKYSSDFQRRIRGENIQTDHATAGAKLVFEHAKTESSISSIAYYLLAYVIAGHHSGLLDMGNPNADGATLHQRLQSSNPELFSDYNSEMNLNFPILSDFAKKLSFSNQMDLGFSLFLYTHFLYSSLVDADRTSAQNFTAQIPKPIYPSLMEMKEKLDSYMSNFSKDKTGDLNAIRSQILSKCRGSAAEKTGMFTLTVPTGGGKTLASLSFALDHAVKNKNIDRIIYTIPFTSIIEQNAGVYKDIFGSENVLEHHSNFIIPDANKQSNNFDAPSGESLKLSLAASNWDAPLILTTNVQFFESLFSAHPSRSRKVHNIANSVIILDEVQALPKELIKPCMYALTELVKNYNCSVVLCTATQPEFKENNLLPNISVKNIIENYAELAEMMKRADCEFIGEKSIDDISHFLRNERQVLCIVNTKRHALDLYNLIKDTENCFYLSTNMYPAHRKKVISEIKRRLKCGEVCRVVSTQLIEAGVDIDFPVVYRSLAGIDSIIQAAGRCNREGKLSIGNVFVFKPKEEYLGTDYLKQTANISDSIIKSIISESDTLSSVNLISPEIVSKYFNELFSINSNVNNDNDDALDKAHVMKLCNDALGEVPSYPFRKISDGFKMISDDGNAVVIPVPEAETILSNLTDKNLGFIQKQISPYCVNVRRRELNAMYKSGLVRIINDSIVVLSNRDTYNEDTGLSVSTPIGDLFYIY